MSNSTSTITAKWQVTIPENVRKELPFKIGQKIVWEVEEDRLVGRRVRSFGELAGCLKSAPVASREENSERGFAKAVVARHDRLSRQKP